ncbi:putative Chalcone synthase 2 [Cocos nucifera]|uniref:Putative Chalcone synthase 2 n=1 Tax=Cocos nucifera TaxID=13894 RepID=A0A8K0IBL9_COCNU|nr:putative Chalcone synthase 2 [Cocos nucifera]
MTSFDAPSLDARQQLLDVEVPRLGAEAATRAIKDWGRPMSDLTHLIFCNSYGASIPGADYDLVKLLGLPLSTKRVMLYQQCCYAGGTVIRLAKDLAENNRDARVLVVCCEINTAGIRGPCESHLEDLVSQALFGDGAGALIIGADPRAGVERSIFEIVGTSQNIIAGSEGALVAKLREIGLMGRLKPEIPMHLSGSIEKLASEALNPVGIADWNEAFWVVHPGGRAILDELEKKLGLGEHKLAATREVLKDYG